LSVVTKDKLPQ